jgi:uncharacterized protein
MRQVCVDRRIWSANGADAVVQHCFTIQFPYSSLGFALLGVLLLVLGSLPYVISRSITRRSDASRPDLPDGWSTARHMLDHHGLHRVQLHSSTNGANYYDVRSESVVLTPSVGSSQSVTSMAVAAHEVAHAVQHHKGNATLRARVIASWVMYGALGLVVLSIIAVVLGERLVGVRVPVWIVAICGLGALIAFVAGGIAAIPNEWDASFAKAMPYLEASGMLSHKDHAAARKVLLLAAMTYVIGGLLVLDLVALPLLFSNVPKLLKYWGIG